MEHSKEAAARREREHDQLRSTLHEIQKSLALLSAQVDETRDDVRESKTPPFGTSIIPFPTQNTQPQPQPDQTKESHFEITDKFVKLPAAWFKVAWPVLKWVAFATISAAAGATFQWTHFSP